MDEQVTKSAFDYMYDYMSYFRDRGIPPKVYGMSKRRNRFKKLYVVAKKK